MRITFRNSIQGQNHKLIKYTYINAKLRDTLVSTILFTAAPKVLKDMVVVGVAPEGDVGAMVVGTHIVLGSFDEQRQKFIMIVRAATTTRWR